MQGVKYIDERLLESPSIAFGQATNEIIRMGRIAEDNLRISLDSFMTGNSELINKVYQNENLINLLETDITKYLVKLSNSELGEAQKTIVSSYFHVVNDIERIGDHAENIADWASEKLTKEISFSQDAINELAEISKVCLETLDSSLKCFADFNEDKVNEVKDLEERIDNLEIVLRSSHIKRLNLGQCSATAGTIFFDLISNLERVGDHSLNIAEILSK